MLKGRLYSKRRKGRPRMRWPDDVENDLAGRDTKSHLAPPNCSRHAENGVGSSTLEEITA
jgi:hypothetical protein